MKKKILFFALTAFLMLSTIACSSDDNKGSDNEKEVEIPNTLKDDYFDIEGAVFNEGEVLEGESDAITEISINKFVINGGKTVATITSSEPLESILVALKGHDGFYAYKTSNGVQTRSGEYTYDVVLGFSQNLNLENFELQFVGVITDGKRTIRYYRLVQLVTAGVGELQINLSWDKEDDVDLHLFDADNNHIYYGSRVLYSTENEKIAELDIDSNPGCNIDGIKNENIYYKNLKDGTYKVYVDLYKKCTNSSGSKYIVNVMHNGVSLHLSDHMMGKFTDNNLGSRNDPSQYVLIGAFSIVNGQFSSIVENPEITRTLNSFNLKEELVYKE
ncbi:hypothetical protein [Myroides odoratus]|uniref:hypothetical protein n=1 Tax=Myroides odoratus TaxID=256 RepID=UPI0039AE992F